MGLGPGPHLLRQASVDLEGEEVHLEVLLLEHRVEEVEEEAHLRHQRGHVLHSLHSRVQLLCPLENRYVQYLTMNLNISAAILQYHLVSDHPIVTDNAHLEPDPDVLVVLELFDDGVVDGAVLYPL